MTETNDKLLDDNPLQEGFTGQYRAWKNLALAIARVLKRLRELEHRVTELEKEL